jgi:hypothetical protein
MKLKMIRKLTPIRFQKASSPSLARPARTRYIWPISLNNQYTNAPSDRSVANVPPIRNNQSKLFIVPGLNPYVCLNCSKYRSSGSMERRDDNFVSTSAAHTQLNVVPILPHIDFHCPSWRNRLRRFRLCNGGPIFPISTQVQFVCPTVYILQEREERTAKEQE